MKNKTSYGLDILQPENIKETHTDLITKFTDFFNKKSYKILEPVDINSGIDPSVYLIGAPISVMKSYLVDKTIPEGGLAMQQPAIRTHCIKTLLDENTPLKWGSTFTGLASLSNHSNKESSMENLFDFLQNTLNIKSNKIQINISSKDEDLCRLIEFIDNDIVVNYDTKNENYYKHKYGLGEIVGRNFNISLQQRDSEVYNDIGNFIIIENGNDKYGIEVALGSSTIMKEIYDLTHTIDCSLLNRIYPNDNNPIKQKLQDSIISSILLYQIGIKANSSNTKGRVLKTYMKGIKLYSEKLNINDAELKNIIEQYELGEYGTIGNFYEYFLEKI